MWQLALRLNTFQIGVNGVDVVVEAGGVFFADATNFFDDWILHNSFSH